MKRFLCIIAAMTLLFPVMAIAADDAVPGVDKFMKEAKADGGMVAVMGLVCKVNPVENRFGMSDSKKFGCCDKPENCITGVLPVEWKGTMPPEGALVRSRGKVVDEGGKLLFRAEDLKVLEQPKK